MLQIGTKQILEVQRDTESGLFLANQEGDEVLLPGKFIPPNTKVGDELDVYIYKDSEERPIATTQKPKITLHQFGYLKVMSINRFGAFLDYGIDKDLFVPYREQPLRMNEGAYYTVYMFLDEKTDRLVGTAKVRKRLSNVDHNLTEGQEVELFIWEKTDIGINTIINNQHIGLLYDNEIFKDLNPGQYIKGYVKKVRYDDKIDVELEPSGYKKIDPMAQQILEALKKANGRIDLSDKSDPDDIYERFSMSKKSFKKAIGALYKSNLIIVEKAYIKLVEEEA